MSIVFQLVITSNNSNYWWNENNSSDKNIILPIIGSVNVTIDWDNGSIITYTSDYPSFTYTSDGTYNISVTGSFTHLNNPSPPDPFTQINFSTYLTEFQYNTQIPTLTNFSNAFSNIYRNFTISIADDTITSNVTDMSYMFYKEYPYSFFGFNEFNSFNYPLTNLNTSNVTNMRYMFYNVIDFNQPLNFDTSKVLDMSYMFYRNNEDFNFNGALNFTDTSKVTNMSNMFNNARGFNQPLNFDTSSVTNMSRMFSDAATFNKDLSFNTSNVTDMNNMFYGARAFNKSLHFDTSKVTNMSAMLRFASGLNQPLHFDTSKVTNMSLMFASAVIFNQDLSFNTSNVTNMNGMFYYALSFNKTLTFNTSKVTNMGFMFYHATSFNQPIDFSDTSKVTAMDQMFSYTNSFNQPLNFNTSSVVNMQYMFYYATSFNQDLSSWNISSLTNADTMFINSGLSSSNYNKLLVGWGNQSIIKNNVPFGAINVEYTISSAQAARDILTNNYEWNITDGGYNPVLYNQAYIDTISEGTYHHVALTISGNIHTLYYDGSAVAIYSNSKDLFPSISNLYIGTSANLTNGYSGSIQDFKVYNRALSSIDISYIYNSPRL